MPVDLEVNLTLKVFEFSDLFSRAPSATMKRYIKIEPALAHVSLNAVASNLPDFSDSLDDYDLENLKLGHLEESIWGKTFKVRFTSRSTGKKFDLNLTFKTKVIKKGNF